MRIPLFLCLLAVPIFTQTQYRKVHYNSISDFPARDMEALSQPLIAKGGIMDLDIAIGDYEKMGILDMRFGMFKLSEGDIKYETQPRRGEIEFTLPDIDFEVLFDWVYNYYVLPDSGSGSITGKAKGGIYTVTFEVLMHDTPDVDFDFSCQWLGLEANLNQKLAKYAHLPDYVLQAFNQAAQSEFMSAFKSVLTPALKEFYIKTYGGKKGSIIMPSFYPKEIENISYYDQFMNFMVNTKSLMVNYYREIDGLVNYEHSDWNEDIPEPTEVTESSSAYFMSGEVFENALIGIHKEIQDVCFSNSSLPEDLVHRLDTSSFWSIIPTIMVTDSVEGKDLEINMCLSAFNSTYIKGVPDVEFNSFDINNIQFYVSWKLPDNTLIMEANITIGLYLFPYMELGAENSFVVNLYFMNGWTRIDSYKAPDHPVVKIEVLRAMLDEMLVKWVGKKNEKNFLGGGFVIDTVKELNADNTGFYVDDQAFVVYRKEG